MGLYTTNPAQYIPLCNSAKFMHIYERETGFITVMNIKKDTVVGVFDYHELCDYLRIRSDQCQTGALTEVYFLYLNIICHNKMILVNCTVEENSPTQAVPLMQIMLAKNILVNWELRIAVKAIAL